MFVVESFGKKEAMPQAQKVRKRGECTTDEAAAYLRVSPGHIRKLVERGDLDARKPARDLLISWTSIYHYEAHRRPVGRPEGAISGDSHNKRGWRETEYQREYKRRVRKGATKTVSKPKANGVAKSSKVASGRAASKGKAASKATSKGRQRAVTKH